MKIKYLCLLLFVAFLFSASCQSGTLILGQLPSVDLLGVNPDDFKGQIIYIYPESEIKDFFEGKKLEYKESITKLNTLQKKCEELTKNIPTYNSMAVAEEHDIAEKLASDCSDEHQFAQDNISQIYFENLPNAKLTTKIKDDGSFAIRVPSNNKYVVILPKHSITWINATGSRKFFMLSPGIDSNADVVL